MLLNSSPVVGSLKASSLLDKYEHFAILHSTGLKSIIIFISSRGRHHTVNKNPSVIEINGKRYDALSGQVVGAVKKVATRVSRQSSGAAIDGFIRKKTSRPAVIGTKKVRKVANTTVVKNKEAPKAFSTGLKIATKGVHRQAQRSRTLMRAVVNKPANTTAAPVAKGGRVKPDLKRISRAKLISKNAKVSRFGMASSAASAKKTPALSIGEVMPKHTVAASHTGGNASSTAIAKPLPSLITSVSHRHLERLLDQALTNADAHKQALRAQLKGNGFWQRVGRAPKWLSISLLLLVILVLGGFFAWQNIPSVAVKVTSLRAHISASTPSYTPSGFKFAGLTNYHSGAITIQYKANSDASRTFAITQEKSNLNSPSLVATELSGNTSQSSQINGKTVYIYGSDNDAAWVDHGIKYSIDDHANLNADQILKIAGSLN